MESLSQLNNRFIKERRILIVDWSNVVQTSRSKSLFRAGATFLIVMHAEAYNRLYFMLSLMVDVIGFNVHDIVAVTQPKTMASQTGQKCIEIGMRWLRTVNAI